MNKPIFIGNREHFALEIEVRSWAAGIIWACVRLWIGGKSLGREDDPVGLVLVMNSLDGTLGRGKDDSLTAELLSIPADAALERLRVTLNQLGLRLYHLPSTEFFDDYEIYCVSDDHVARFLWMARHWDTDVLHDVRVPRDEVVRTLNDLHAVHNALLQGYEQQDRGGGS